MKFSTDPPYGHPPIESPFETIYECTIGAPLWKTKPYDASSNLIGYQRRIKDYDHYITEHRASYINPRLQHSHFESPPGMEVVRTPEFHPSTLPSHHLPFEEEQLRRNAKLEKDPGCPISSDRLLPTSQLGTLRHYARSEFIGTPYTITI